jgi:transposase InsO family protein
LFARASKRAQVETIHHIFKESKDIYGARKIREAPGTSGTCMSEWTVRRIRRENGMHYLAAVIDLYNREIIGYSTRKNMDTELVKQAITNAIARYP